MSAASRIGGDRIAGEIVDDDRQQLAFAQRLRRLADHAAATGSAGRCRSGCGRTAARSRRSVAMNMTVPATRQIGTSRLRSKVSSLTTSAEPISAPRTASWPAMPPTMPAPAKEPTSSVDRGGALQGDGERRAGAAPPAADCAWWRAAGGAARRHRRARRRCAPCGWRTASAPPRRPDAAGRPSRSPAVPAAGGHQRQRDLRSAADRFSWRIIVIDCPAIRLAG